jgi:hypothetical protein
MRDGARDLKILYTQPVCRRCSASGLIKSQRVVFLCAINPQDTNNRFVAEIAVVRRVVSIVACNGLCECILTGLAQVSQMRSQAHGYSAAAWFYVGAKLFGVRRA